MVILFINDLIKETMKTIITFKNIWLVGILFWGIALAACSDDEDSATPITISSITTIKDLTTPITQAALGDFIAIHGTGLNIHNIDSVLVNNIRVDMKEVYAENNVLYMKIPVKIATKETDKVYVYNKAGVQEFALKAVAPDLSAERMFNEYTKPGDTIMIYGNFFKLYEIDSLNAVVDFNGKLSRVISSADNYLTAKVPTDVDKNIKVKVKGLKYGVEATCPGRYYDRECMIMDFDDLMPSDPTNVVTDVKDKQRFSGNFLRIDNKSAWSSWWYIASKDDVDYPADMYEHPEDYVVKCEFRTANQFIDGKIAFYNYLFWAIENPMAWKATDFVIQNFNRWETITLPLTLTRSEAYPYPTYGNDYYRSFNMRLDIDASIARNFSFDNIRIYKKND